MPLSFFPLDKSAIKDYEQLCKYSESLNKLTHIQIMTPVGITCNHKQMKQINTGAIFAYLNKKDTASRVELARELDLDRKTVTNLVRDLISQNLLYTEGQRKHPMGRPEKLLYINPKGAEAIGVCVEPHRISAAVVNLKGIIEYRCSKSITASDTAVSLLSKIQNIISSLMKKTSADKLAGIGLGYFGILDTDTGKIIKAANFPQWQGVNIYEYLEESFDIPWVVEDTSRCIAMAEHWFGAARQIEDFVLLDAGTGIGAILVIHGSPLAGVKNQAGELGHIVVQSQGRLCQCGKKGCLETEASLDSVVENFRNQNPEHHKINYKGIVKLASQQHEAAFQALQNAGRHIGTALSHLLNIYNPGQVVFCGEMFENNKILENSVKQVLHENLFENSYKATVFHNSTIKKGNTEIGAAALILKKTFEKAV